LSQAGIPLPTPLVNTSYRDRPIYAAAENLAPLAEIDCPKKARISHFLDLLVQFRNKKRGHGSLTPIEAERIVAYLEATLVT
jgi:hypothetical protein